MNIPPTAHHPSKTKRRRRWPWITGAVVLAILVLGGIFGNKPQTTGTPTVGTVDTIVTASSTSGAPTTTASATTTTVAAVVAPPVTTTVPAVVVAPRTTHQAAPKPVPPPVAAPPVAPPPVVAPPVAPPPPVTGKYHAGEFCKTVGATAISTTGAPMTCLQEGSYKRWHNN